MYHDLLEPLCKVVLELLTRKIGNSIRPLIVYQAPWNWEFLWNRSQPLSTALASRATVFYLNCGVDEPGPLMKICRLIPKLRGLLAGCYQPMRYFEVNDNLRVFRWRGLWRNDYHVATQDRIHSAYRKLVYLIQQMSKSHDEVWLLTSRPMAQGLLTLYPWDKLLVDLEDPWLSLSWGERLSKDLVLKFLQRADVIYANGEKISSEYANFCGRSVQNLPNGIDTDFVNRLVSSAKTFSEILTERCGLKAVFTGNFNDRVDLSGLITIAEKCPFITLVFVGLVNIPNESAADLARLRALPNAVFIPYVTHDRLPGILSSADALLLPYAHAGSQLMFPAKLYEYIAAAKPILMTSDFGLGCAIPPSVRIFRSTADFVTGLKELEQKKWKLTAEQVASCQEQATKNTWNKRADLMISIAAGIGRHAR